LTILAHTLARAVSYLLKHQTAFALDTFLRGEGRGVRELKASLDSDGRTLILNARAGVNPGVCERPCASRVLSLSPRFDETPPPASVCPGCLASTPGLILARTIRCARASRTPATLASVSFPSKGHPHGPPPRPPSSPSHQPVPCRRQGRGHLSTAGRCEKLARQVAGARRCPESRLGSGKVSKTHEPPDPNASKRRTGRRGPAPDMTPTRHRR
jgi:hypothetical protein